MERLIEQLQDAGFSAVPDAFGSGGPDVGFVSLVCALCSELEVVLQLEEHVQQPDSVSGQQLLEWKLQLSSFLKELQCPISFLCVGDLNERFQQGVHRQVLADFLLSELLAARMAKFGSEGGVQKNEPCQNLMVSLNALSLNSPPFGVTSAQLFERLRKQIMSIPADKRNALIGQPLFSGATLSKDQWQVLATVADELAKEYSVRRQMLITRLRATLQSFCWSDKISCPSDELAEALSMKKFSRQCIISVSDVLSARRDLAVINKVSALPLALQQTKNPLKKVKVGRVPDRGGRPLEQAAPPPEMPAWQKNRSGTTHDVKKFYRGGGGAGGSGGRRPQQSEGYQGGHQNYAPGGYQGGHQNYPPGGFYGHQGQFSGGQDPGRHNFAPGGYHGHQAPFSGGYEAGWQGHGSGGNYGQDAGQQQQRKEHRNRHRGVQGSQWKK